MRVLPKQLSVRLGSYPGGGPGQPCPSKPRGKRSASGGLASERAVTRVNPEHVSKNLMRTPTFGCVGEGRCAEGKQLTDALFAAAGVVGTARPQGRHRNVGGPGRRGAATRSAASGGGLPGSRRGP